MLGGKYAEALASFDAALALRKDHSLGQRLRAEALFRLGRFEEVIKAFDRYLETGKPLESVYRGRGLARAELGQYPGAIDDFTKALELHPTSAVQAYRGWMHLAADAPKLALRDFELAIDLDSEEQRCLQRPWLRRGRAWAATARRSRMPTTPSVSARLRRGCSTMRRAFYAQSSGAGPHRALGFDLASPGLAPRGSAASLLVHVCS